jgi:hypothetical protein
MGECEVKLSLRVASPPTAFCHKTLPDAAKDALGPPTGLFLLESGDPVRKPPLLRGVEERVYRGGVMN